MKGRKNGITQNKKGFDVKIIGAPKSEIQNFTNTNKYAVYPTEFEGIKPRLLVKVGDKVKRGRSYFLIKEWIKLYFDHHAVEQFRH